MAASDINDHCTDAIDLILYALLRVTALDDLILWIICLNQDTV